jgi:hypothetical protein
MTMNWSEGLLYAYPPLSFILPVLAKIRREEAEVIAIMPWWPARGWFPLLLDMLVDLPILLPRIRSLLTGPQGDPHPTLTSLHLVVWRLSGNSYRQQEFLQLLPLQLATPSEKALNLFTKRNGCALIAGVKEKISIPFTVL